MIDYLLFHVPWSLAILAVLWRLRSAPPRLRFYLSMLGLIVWLMPLPWVTIPVPVSNALVYERFQVFDGPADPVAVETPDMAAAIGTWRSDIEIWAAILMLGTGAFLWFRDLGGHRRAIRVLAADSRENEAYRGSWHLPDYVSLRIIPGSGATTTGLFRPIIWLGEAHVNKEEEAAAVMHEWVHIQNHDNHWLCVIHFVDRLFWWNPLVRLLSKKARLYIEMNCDLVCQVRMSPERYRRGLAQILMTSAGLNANPTLITAAIFNERSESLQRIDAIGRNYPMKMRHFLTLILILGFFGLLAAFPRPVPGMYQEPELITPISDNPVARVGQPGVEPPAFTRKVAPVYPKKGTDKKIEGFVILEAILQKNGTVGEIQILRGLGKGKYGFEESAKNAVSQWKFEPGTVNGKVADVRMTFKIDFVLRDNKAPVEIRQWSAGDGDSQRFRAPQVYIDRGYLDKMDQEARLTLPVVVQISPQGVLLGYEADQETLARVAFPEKVLENIEEALTRYSWESASQNGVPMETELEIAVSVPLI